MDLTKKCKTCREEKPVDDFAWSVFRKRANGVSKRYQVTSCKACQNMYARNKDSIKKSKAAYQRKYRLRNLEEFNRKKDASRRANKEAHNARCKRWADSNKEKRRVVVLACEHKRRLSKWRKNRGLCRIAVEEVLELARIGNKYLDAYSGELIDKPTIDHVLPLSLGGTNDAENLCVTSLENNSSKHNDLLIVWLARRIAAGCA